MLWQNISQTKPMCSGTFKNTKQTNVMLSREPMIEGWPAGAGVILSSWK